MPEERFKTGWIAVCLLGLWMIILVLLLLVFQAIDASAHSWYDPACCNGDDCAPDDRVKEVVGGFEVPTGEVIPYGDKRIRQSLDKQFHWCHVQAHTYCVYVPGGST